MNTNPNLDAASASSTRDHPCYGIDPNVAALNVFADDEHSYLLPYAQFLCADTTPNPALETNADAPPEQMLIRFAAADVWLRGSGLAAIEKAVQRYELKFVKTGNRQLAAPLKTHVADVAVNFTKPTL